MVVIICEVFDSYRAQLLTICKEVRLHVTFALHFDMASTLELVWLIFQHLVNLFCNLEYNAIK